ncbi:MAG: hypothetical protein ACE5EE_04800 [Fidelibacterota bacterium]
MLERGDVIEPFVLVDHMGIECRVGSGGRKIVFFFPKANTPG